MAIKLWIVNLLTLIRVIGTIILIPIYNNYGGIKAGIFSLICYLTDSVDGILARKWKVSTFFGAIFDGISDKLFTIINFIVLYLITPYAIIPIIFEILITLIQLFKFSNNYNIKSNMFGKIKVWILAISLVILFIVSDITNATFIPITIRESILRIPSKTMYFYLLLPAILSEALTFLSYVVEIFKPSKKVVNLDLNKKKIDTSEFKNTKGLDYFKAVWLNPKFYQSHKNDTNLKDLWNLTRETE